MPRNFLAFCLLALWLQTSLFNSPAQESGFRKTEKATPRDAPSDATIKQLVQQMGDRDFAEREAAMKRLEGIGKAALPALREAAKNHADAEVRRRAQRLVERLAPEPDPLDKLLEEAGKAEHKKDYKKAAELFDKAFATAKARHSPGTAAPLTDIPILTDISLKTARVRKCLDEYEKAASAYHLASYYSNYNNEKSREIDREWSAMATDLLAGWEKVVKRKINEDDALKALTAKYPLVLLHSRRFAGDRYLFSTYSFLYETGEEGKHFNDVQLQFDNGSGKNTFNLNCVVGQEDRVADLGEVDFTKDPSPVNIGTDGKSRWTAKECKAAEGHVYLEEIKDSNGNHFFVVFQVIATDKDSRFVAFVWRKLPGGTVVKRP
jgi:hypothetical protein